MNFYDKLLHHSHAIIATVLGFFGAVECLSLGGLLFSAIPLGLSTLILGVYALKKGDKFGLLGIVGLIDIFLGVIAIVIMSRF